MNIWDSRIPNKNEVKLSHRIAYFFTKEDIIFDVLNIDKIEIF